MINVVECKCAVECMCHETLYSCVNVKLGCTYRAIMSSSYVVSPNRMELFHIGDFLLIDDMRYGIKCLL